MATGGWHSPGRRLDEGGGVQVVDLVELQQGGQVVELLVADLKAAVGQGVDDVVGNPRVLGHREHVVPGAGGRVPHQEHAVPLPLQPRLRLRPGHRAHVPAGAVRRIETGGGGHGSGRGRLRARGRKAASPKARQEESRGREGPGGEARQAERGWGLGGRGERPALQRGSPGGKGGQGCGRRKPRGAAGLWPAGAGGQGPRVSLSGGACGASFPPLPQACGGPGRAGGEEQRRPARDKAARAAGRLR